MLFCGLCGVCIGLFALRRDDIDRPKSLQRLFCFSVVCVVFVLVYLLFVVMTLIDQSLCRGCLLFCGLCGVCTGLFALRRDDIDRPKSLQRLFCFSVVRVVFVLVYLLFVVMTVIDQSLCRGCLLFCGLCGVCTGLFALRRDDIDRLSSLQRLFCFSLVCVVFVLVYLLFVVMALIDQSLCRGCFAFLWFVWCLYWFICSSS